MINDAGIVAAMEVLEEKHMLNSLGSMLLEKMQKKIGRVKE